ncbi:MAG: CpXC domain-containing protein [Spirochaetaceae bacterium]|jgi:hypothetical protein|nr:CpXC domain-containing protein [Spirochaetaceae bacterium]
MKRKITCLCENSFSVEFPEEIDLDRDGFYLDEITNGGFMSFTCPTCGKAHKPEFPLIVSWPLKGIRLETLPEQERGAFYHRKKEKSGQKAETLIGYPELADRLAVIRDGLEPAAVESLKYYLLRKAEESDPGADVTIYYRKLSGGDLEFYLQGLRPGEVAISRIPRQVYEKTLENYRKRPRGEPFSSLRYGSYLSVQNMLLPGNP